VAPAISEIESSMSDWSLEELRAFFCCVRSSEAVPVPDTREDLVRMSLRELFWAYSSRTAAHAKQSADKVKQAIYDHLPGRMKVNIPRPQPAKELHEYGSALSYEYLVREVCKKLKIDDANIEPIRALEVYLIEDLFVQAAARMNAQQRHAFLTCQIHLARRFCNGIPAHPSFRSGDDFGGSGSRSRVRFWCLPRSDYRARFLVSRCRR
jgi:hypothetical protein